MLWCKSPTCYGHSSCGKELRMSCNCICESGTVMKLPGGKVYRLAFNPCATQIIDVRMILIVELGFVLVSKSDLFDYSDPNSVEDH